MDSLSHIVSKTCCHFVATTNISVVGVGQIAAQERESKTMATELVAGSSQIRLIAINA
jgi:hypothetical protein